MTTTRKINGKELNGSSYNKGSFIETSSLVPRTTDHESAAASITAESEKRKETWHKEVETPERIQNENRFTEMIIASIDYDSKVKETLMSVFDNQIIRREIRERVSVGLASCSRDKESSNLWKMYILTYGRVSEPEKQHYENEIVKMIIDDIHCYANNILRGYKRP
jgi:hypothetical protein